METSPSTGITRLRYRLADVEQLDPAAPKDPRFDTVAQAIQSNIREIFGEDSPEDTNHWNLRIEHTDGPFLLGGYYDEEDDEVGSYGNERANARRVKERREGIAHTKVILESLIKQLEERAAEHAKTQHAGVGDMGSPLDHLANDRITLIKSGGQTTVIGVKALVQPGKILVPQAAFDVEPGDTIVREMEPGQPTERYEVLDPHYLKAPGDMSHWQIKVRRISSRSLQEPPSSPTQTHVTHNYNISGPTAAVGPGATATENAIIQHNNQQTLNLDLDLGALADDLAAIKKALLAQAADDDDDHEAAEEAAKVAKAQKAIKAGEHSGIVSAVRALGAKTWALGEKLALAYVNFKLRNQLGLPPGDS